jgi:hypothetical protein
VEHNRSVVLNDYAGVKEMNESIAQRINAPVRDLELNVSNIIYRLLMRKEVSQSIGKGFELIRIMLDKPISPSDRTLDILTDTLAQAAVRSLSDSEESGLSEFLREVSVRNSRSFNIYQVYLEKKEREPIKVIDQDDRLMNHDFNDGDVILF